MSSCASSAESCVNARENDSRIGQTTLHNLCDFKALTGKISYAGRAEPIVATSGELSLRAAAPAGSYGTRG